MQLSDFSYDLPPDLIAQQPLAKRSASRLLTLDGASGAYADRCMRDLPGLLRPGDLLVFNDTRVVAARLIGSKPSGGRVEVFLERPLEGDAALVQMRAGKAIRPGLEVTTPGGVLEVLHQEGDLWRVRLPSRPLEFFEQWGEVPLPPYIRRTPQAADRERYQSVFARKAGAVAAPTASLHFDAALLEALRERRVAQTFVTLHVGAGTFQPVRTADLSSHVMHAERVSVSEEACDAVMQARARDARVIAVGTTVARALESAALHAAAAGGSRLAPWSGETRLFIRPGFQFRVIDALLTNFHLPESTLLMLVCAFAGREPVLAAYEHAVRERYRFFSYGDAMFVTPAPYAKIAPDACVS